MNGANKNEAQKERICLVVSFCLPFILYLLTLAPSVLNDDPGEYQLVLAALGVAHPTGYPLYTLVGHLFVRLVPVGDAAYRVNLFSAVAGAAAVATLYRLLRELAIGRRVALPAALLFAVSADSWMYATIAQTYALNAFLIVLALFTFARWQRERDTRMLVVLAGVTGLGMAHHSTFWLMTPALAIGAALTLTASGSWGKTMRERRAWLAPVAFCLPLALYLYILLRGEHLMMTLPGDLLGVPQAVVSGLLTPHYLPGWTNVVIGSFYAGSTLGGAELDWGRGIRDYLLGLRNQFLGLEALALGILTPIAFQRRRAFVVLMVVAWLTNVVIVTRGVAAFNEPAGGLYTPTYLLCAVAIALTLEGVLVSRAGLMRLLPTAMPAVLMAGAVVIGVHALGQVLASPFRQRDYRAWAQVRLDETLPRSAVILGAWSQVTPLRYVQVVEGVRPDVAILQAPLASLTGRDFILRVLDARRPLYLLNSRDELVAIPLPQPPTGVRPLAATFGGEITLIGYAVQDRASDTTQRLHLYWRAEKTPAADYRVFVHGIQPGGQELPGNDAPPVIEYFPTSLWRAGQVFEDRRLVWVVGTVEALEIGLYDAATLKRLALPDGKTTIRIAWQ